MSRSLPDRRSVQQMPLADAIRTTAEQLSKLPASASELFDALAFVLSRVADADREISAAEARRMELVLEQEAGLNPAQAALVVEVAKHRKRIADTARAYGVSRQLRHRLDVEQRIRMIDALFDVAAADGQLAESERAEILQVAAELGFAGDDVIAGRQSGVRG